MAEELLSLIDRRLGKQEYRGDGDALIKTLLQLRGWQVQPQRDGRTPMHIILAERAELLARRERALSCQGSVNSPVRARSTLKRRANHLFLPV